jgi:hypothetical protein
MWILVAALMIAGQAGRAAPVIEKTTVDGEHLAITFAKGAVGVSTVYQEQVVREEWKDYFPGSMYAPRHAIGIDDPLLTTIEEDWAFIERNTPPTKWLVWTEVYYPAADPRCADYTYGVQHQADCELVMVETNRVEVMR